MSGKATEAAQGWLNVVLLWIAGIVAAMQFAKMSIGFAAFEESYATNPATVSTLLSAAGFFGLIFGLWGVSLVAAIGFRRILMWSLAVAAILSFAQAVQPSIAVFYLLRIIEGATNLFIVVAAPTLISLHAPPRHIPSAMALWGTFYGVAFMVTGAVGPSLLFAGEPFGLLIAHGVLAIVIAGALFFRDLYEPVREASRKQPNWTQMLLQQLRHLAEVYATRQISLAGVIFFFHSSMYLGVLIFVPQIAPDQETTNLLLFTMPAFSILGTLIVGPLHQAFLRSRPTMMVGFIFMAIVCMAMLIVADNAVAFLMAANLLMLVSGLLQGSIFILPSQIAGSAQNEALAFGIIAQLGSLGSIIGPIVFALAVERGGLPSFTMLLIAFAACGLCCVIIGLRKDRSTNSSFFG
ncbi:MAG: MFS transporter [Paracoccaceae bacterium]